MRYHIEHKFHFCKPVVGHVGDNYWITSVHNEERGQVEMTMFVSRDALVKLRDSIQDALGESLDLADQITEEDLGLVDQLRAEQAEKAELREHIAGPRRDS